MKKKQTILNIKIIIDTNRINFSKKNYSPRKHKFYYSFANKHGFGFWETSAKTSTNIDQAFLDLIDKIYNGLNSGGVFVLSEKIKMDCPVKQDRLTQLHHAFKKANGYSDLEISQKRTSLENVLLPETIDAHIQRLKNTGFSEVMVWFQCFNFVSILAIK